MLLAAEIYLLLKGRVACAKYHLQNHSRCIFCEYQAWHKASNVLKKLNESYAPAELIAPGQGTGPTNPVGRLPSAGTGS